MGDQIVVLDGFTLNPGDLSWEGFESIGPVKVYDRTSADEVGARAAGAAHILTNKTPLPAATLAKLPLLRYIGVLATGYNIVDVAAESLIVEVSGDEDKVDSLHELLKPFGVIEVMRTGTIALNRGMGPEGVPRRSDNATKASGKWGEATSV